MAETLDSIFLHLGLQKCGSTAIQHGLRSISEQLVGEGLYYPDGDHAIFASYYAGSRPDFFHNWVHGRTDQEKNCEEDRAFFEGVFEGARAAACRTLVLSYEGFPNLRPAEVEAMVRDLLTRAERVVGIVYCRHPLSFAPSEISQRARSGVTTAVFTSAPPLLPFKNYLPKFVSAFGLPNMVARDFDRRALADGNVIADFLGLLPVSPTLRRDAPAITPPSSMSLSTEAVRIAEKLAALADADQPMAHAFRPHLQQFLMDIEGTPIRLSDEEKAFLLAESEPHLAYLSETFGLDLLAPPDTGDGDEQALFGPAFVESLARAVRRLLDEIESSEPRATR